MFLHEMSVSKSCQRSPQQSGITVPAPRCQ
jgi:hypothetical protein